MIRVESSTKNFDRRLSINSALATPRALRKNKSWVPKAQKDKMPKARSPAAGKKKATSNLFGDDDDKEENAPIFE